MAKTTRRTIRMRAIAATTALAAAASPLPVLAWAAPIQAAPAARSEPSETVEAMRQRLPQDEVIYFLLPDRFANGDASNDHGGYDPQRLISGFDPTDT
ncbi:hypothetical protein, partial [Klebsiella pneumoniae]|uniref:hypothetical protein n=1 Tax=Klebsiella pneumoniae TaxID=573 RepID=UPI001E60F477